MGTAVLTPGGSTQEEKNEAKENYQLLKELLFNKQVVSPINRDSQRHPLNSLLI